MLKTLVPDEREITTGKNKVFFMRVAPYRTTENKILGCVITLVDVTTQKQGQVMLQSTEEMLIAVQKENERKSDYLANIALQIRSEMDALYELSKQARLYGKDKPQLENLDKITETIDKMSVIVSDIIKETGDKPGDIKAKSGDAKKTKKAISLAGCNFLVAEDNQLNMTILGSILTHEGITFEEAGDGESAVKAYVDAPDNSFDCILMDMKMPGIDGIKATMMIRASGKSDCQTIPIIGVSANGFTDDIKQARAAGISGYITKPIDRDKLFDTIRDLVRKS